MKIAFFGAFGSFDFFKIGGTESFARRLTTGLRARGYRSDFVVYGKTSPHHQRQASGTNCYAFGTLPEGLNFIQEQYDHVVTMYVPPRDRLPYWRFQQTHRRHLTVHRVLFSWPESWVKRQAAFLEACLLTGNGRLFCVSPRIYRWVSRWSHRAVLLLPPVPEEFFLNPQDKPDDNRLRITYIGRTEPAKGIIEVLELFRRLRDFPDVVPAIHGYHHSSNRAARYFHEQLSHQKEIPYYSLPYEGYTPAVERKVLHILRDTDILLLPYRRLSSTIDTPLLLLEAMATLSAVVTYPLGDIPKIYGSGPFLVSKNDSMVTIADRLLKAHQVIPQERQRLQQRNQELKLNLNQILNQFLTATGE